MILKVSHLVFSSTNFEENSHDFTALGYNSIFTEHGLMNPEIKKILFRRFSETHDVRYFSLEQSVGIELLNWHSHKSKQQSNFTPFFQGLPRNLLSYFWERKGQSRSAFSFFEGTIPTLQLPFFFSSWKDGPAQLNGLYVKTGDLEESISFWRHFRFDVREHGKNYALLTLTSILPRTPDFTLYLEKVEFVNKNPHLDDKGVSCISFLSSSIEREKDLLKSAGFQLVDIGSLLINQKKLTIFFTLGPAGELIEVINIKNASPEGDYYERNY